MKWPKQSNTIKSHTRVVKQLTQRVIKKTATEESRNLQCAIYLYVQHPLHTLAITAAIAVHVYSRQKK